MKGENHAGTQEILRAGGRGKQGMSECGGSAELQFPGGLLPLHPLLPLESSFHLMTASELSVAGISLLPVACKKNLCIWHIDCGRVVL